MKIGRNDPCPCGSGRKFKLCCLARQDDAQSLPQVHSDNIFEDEPDDGAFVRALADSVASGECRMPCRKCSRRESARCWIFSTD
jgi:hypothetical protein